jgi:hypothetical protein
MTLYRVWEGDPPNGLPKIPQEVSNFVNDKGHYNKERTKKGGFIAVFGANEGHLTQCATGIHKGGGQAEGVADCKNVMPLDTMYYANDEDKNGLTRESLLATIRYQFAEMLKRPNTPFIIPYKVLTADDIDKLKFGIISEHCKNPNAVEKWRDKLKVGDAIVNMGFGICAKPDIEVLYEINTLAEKAIASQNNTESDSRKVAGEIESWKTEVLPNVASIKNGQPAAAQQAGNKIEKFQNVLKVLRNNNQGFKDLSSQQILNIFTEASGKRYYTNGNPKLPLDASGNSINDEKAKLMRKFSVEFQKQCKNQGLTFSKTAKDNVNTNGMRTKSVVDFLNQKNNNGNIENLINEVWGKK